MAIPSRFTLLQAKFDPQSRVWYNFSSHLPLWHGEVSTGKHKLDNKNYWWFGTFDFQERRRETRKERSILANPSESGFGTCRL